MRSRTFRTVALTGRIEIQDERGIPFADLRKADAGTAALLRAAAQKAYRHGVADAYARTWRSFHLAKGNRGEHGRSWDLLATGAGVECLAWLPRSRLMPWTPKAARELLALAGKAYVAGRSDAGGNG